MHTQRLLQDAPMMQLLGAALKNFERQGVICEITSPNSVSFSSTLPQAQVQEIFDGSSVPMKPLFDSAAVQGCRGSAVVQGIMRADE